MKFNEDDMDIMDGDHIIDDGYIDDDFSIGEEVEYSEVELNVAEPTKIVDEDGSVVIVTPGDIVTVKTESIKRVNVKS